MSNEKKGGLKLKLKSVKNMESEQKRKLILISGVVGFIIFLMVQIVVQDGSTRTRPVAAKFEDTTPEPTTAEALTISRLQKQMDEMDEEIKRRKREEARLSVSLKKEIEDAKEAQRKKDGLTERRLDALTRELAEAKKAKARAERDQRRRGGDSDDSSSPAVKRDEQGNPYLVPPMPQDSKPSGPVTIPPAASGAGAGQAPAPEREKHWTELDEPIVLTGDDQKRSNVLRGSKQEQRSARKKSNEGSYLPMGSFNKVSFLTGADFGAGRQTQSNPQPVLMRIMGDSVMPNDGSYKLKHCAAMGSGYGEMSSERVYISITRLSCVDTNTGKTLETPIVAYAADTDGKLGMRGKLVNREGAVMARAMLAGFAEGASDMFNLQAQNLESTITGAGVHQTMDTNRAGEVGAYGGAAKAMEMLADHYLDQAKAIFPVIEIDSGRNATIVVQEGQHLNWQDARAEGDS